MSVPRIDPIKYDYVVTRIRKVCKDYGLTEVFLNDINSTLSCCEQPENARTFEWNGTLYALPQTQQMNEEVVLLNNPHLKGIFNITTSYRLEQNPVPNRHSDIFSLFEIELQVDQRGMIEFQKKILLELGIKPFHGDSFPEIDYLDACAKYGVEEIGNEEEAKLCIDLDSPAVFLKNFPASTLPFFNMARNGDIYEKVDVIIGKNCGMETIGSSCRSNDPNDMRNLFRTASGGAYSKYLYDMFGEERINKELEEYLSNKFFTRSGMGIGLARLVYACQSLGIFDHLDQ